MIRVLRNVGLLGVLLLSGCQQTPTAISLRSLAHSGTLSILCRDMTTGMGGDIKGCPDPYATKTDGRHTLLMVTQTRSGEVAVIDMHNRVVLDQDPTVPGTEFLPIGGIPVSILSTPGGVATYVASKAAGRDAIFAIPTSCVVAPPSGQPQHDLTQWSACKLPSEPGEMALLTDTALNSLGELRRTCDGDGQNDLDPATQAICPSDWDAEQRIAPAGRRKILVTLPRLGRIAIIDARNLSDGTPGKFEACKIERLLPLSTTVPTGTQSIPRDLQDANCQLAPRYPSGPAKAYFSQPAGISVKDGNLYVADLGVPLVHVVDVSNPCDPHETEPFLPTSFDKPDQTVYTSDVVVSDLTSQNERFVYAVDDNDKSLMAFDASASSAQKTPMVERGSQYLPFEAPDRIRTNLQNAAVKDLLFVKHDVPVVEAGSLTAQTGVKCDPSLTATSPASDYRTAGDYARGASPMKLRGIFAVAALSDGYVSLVDVDDWDAKCRRPVVGNTTASPEPDLPLVDWRGCHDDSQPRFEDPSTQVRTVSDEASCNVVEAHHARSGRFMGNNSSLGVGSPSLQALPTLTSVSGALSAGGTSRTVANPRLLAVPFANTAAGTPLSFSELYVGTTHYYIPKPGSPETLGNSTLLNVEPSTANQNSLLLPQVEPRAYLPAENFSVTYEGKLFDDRVTGYVLKAELTLSDPDANFCDQGVQDLDVASKRAADFISDYDPNASAMKSAFGPTYADIVQITSDFTDSDPYWSSPFGAACAKDAETGVSGIAGCRNYFGTPNNFTTLRDWQITEAYQGRLVFQPAPDATKDAALAISNLHCCFPGTVSYTVRAKNHWLLRGQQPMHNIVVGANSRCVIEDSCSHRKQLLRNRIIEISSTAFGECDASTPPKCKCTSPDSTGQCSIGPATTVDAACIVPNNAAIDPSNYTSEANHLGQSCVFDSLRGRFAIYRGTTASVRDMAFRWQVTGGFVPYELNLANRLTGSAIMPQALISAPSLNAMFVVDGVSGGVFAISLDPFGIIGDPYL